MLIAQLLLYMVEVALALTSTITPVRSNADISLRGLEKKIGTLHRRTHTHQSCNEYQAWYLQEVLVQVAWYADCARRGIREHVYHTERSLMRWFQGHARTPVDADRRSIIDHRYQYIIEETINRRGSGRVQIVCDYRTSSACMDLPHLVIDTISRRNSLTLVY